MRYFPALRYVLRAATLLAPILLFGPLPSESQISGSSTGWCTDYQGNNFRCSDGSPTTSSSSSDSGYNYGGGCANMYANTDTAISASNSKSALKAGNQLWDDGHYEAAAGMYEMALFENPNNITARGNLAGALNKLGIASYDYGNYPSAWLYFKRAVDYGRKENLGLYSDNAEAAAEEFYDSPDCSMCSRAIINDIGYGLRNSAMFQSYADQAAANFGNCTWRVKSECNNTDGKWLKDQIRNCSNNIFNRDGVKACIETAWESVN